MPYGKPLRHMREVIGLVRLLVAKAHTGELGVLEGEYHRLDLSHFRTFAPPVRTAIPIYLPAVFEKACELAGEIADGLLGHPLWNEKWIAEQTLPALRRGLRRGGRERDAVTLNLQMFVAVNSDRRAAIEDARPSVTYTASRLSTCATSMKLVSVRSPRPARMLRAGRHPGNGRGLQRRHGREHCPWVRPTKSAGACASARAQLMPAPP